MISSEKDEIMAFNIIPHIMHSSQDTIKRLEPHLYFILTEKFLSTMGDTHGWGLVLVVKYGVSQEGKEGVAGVLRVLFVTLGV